LENRDEDPAAPPGRGPRRDDGSRGRRCHRHGDKDSATAVPRSQYFEVTLTDLDGSGYLSGKWANVRTNTGTPAYTTDGTYFYDRHDDQFEQVMAYYWGTQAQYYLQSLGFGSELPTRPCGSTAHQTRLPRQGHAIRTQQDPGPLVGSLDAEFGGTY
jgi:hypothetical protein